METPQKVRETNGDALIAMEERAEAERHDELYGSVSEASLLMDPSDWQKFDGLAAPHPEPYVHSVLRLGDVRDKTVLDAGCGDGWFSVILAKRGAVSVDAFDISGEAVRLARTRARVNGVSDQVNVKTASIYDIPAADRRYDLVAGHAILHHVRDKNRCVREVRRVLKPGGLAVFLEPLGSSSWLERLRLLVPVPSSAPDDPEHWKDQIRHTELEELRQTMGISWREFHLFSRLDRIVRAEPIVSAIARMDMALLDRFGFLRPYARAVVVELRREGE